MAQRDPYNCERCGELLRDDDNSSTDAYLFICNACYRKEQEQVPVAPCVFLGIQEGIKHIVSTALFNLTSDMAGHGYKFRCGSTVTEHSVNEAGYRLPEAVAAEAKQAMQRFLENRCCK